VRQRAYFRRHAAFRENPRDIPLIGLRANQALVKAIGLPELKANARDGIAKLRRRGLLAEGVQDAALMRGQIFRSAGAEAAQQVRVARLGL